MKFQGSTWIEVNSQLPHYEKRGLGTSRWVDAASENDVIAHLQYRQKSCSFECSHTGSPIITPWEVHFCGNMIVLLVGKVNLYSDNHYLVMDKAWMILSMLTATEIIIEKRFIIPLKANERKVLVVEFVKKTFPLIAEKVIYFKNIKLTHHNTVPYPKTPAGDQIHKIDRRVGSEISRYIYIYTHTVVEDDTEFSVIKCDMMVKETSLPRWG
ncbi:unnamed protein product [Brugia pahangi]|uniref:PRELI/MSF1 domain-containing protein n=1 Tax=Brugia pahangi TaxID=6280 RepID=A0A0N4TKJ0_BRUPA|nr:unnamed protein product [Brugia pahangi]